MERGTANEAAMAEGVFITFEGGDGSGKSTQIQRVRDWFESQGRQVSVTREPGGTELGKEIRRLVQNGPEDVDPRSEALLYAADRAYHVATRIRPVHVEKLFSRIATLIPQSPTRGPRALWASMKSVRSQCGQPRGSTLNSLSSSIFLPRSGRVVGRTLLTVLNVSPWSFMSGSGTSTCAWLMRSRIGSS